MMWILQAGLAAISLAAAALYGFVLLRRSPSLVRTAVKAKAVGALATIGWVEACFGGRGGWLLAVGLTLSALGDAFLAGDPKKGLPFGLVSFLLAHAAYIVVFLHAGGGVAMVRLQPIRVAAILAAVAGAVFVMRLSWPTLGPMRGPALVYMLAILAMVVAAAALPVRRWSAIAGALAFFASDGVLAVRLFKHEGRPDLAADLAVWWLYYGGQAGIAWAFLS